MTAVFHRFGQHFSHAHPAVTALVVGACHPDEIRANVRHWQVDIPLALWPDLQESGLLHKEAPLPSAG